MSYIATMSLRKNVPESPNDDCRITVCPSCGCECWYDEVSAFLVKGIYRDVQFLCAECALRSAQEGVAYDG